MDEKTLKELSKLSLLPEVVIKPALGTPIIEAVRGKIRTEDQYPLEATKTRNIIMLGRSGSGKSTAVAVLKDPCDLPTKQSLFSDTYGAKFQSFAIDDKKTKTKYSINIIDTPGVQEVKPMGENARSDESIIETIKVCLKNEITKIHTLLIFASFDGRISVADKAAFEIYLRLFYDTHVNIAFCITKTEGKDRSWEEQIEKDLRNDEFFTRVVNTENIKMYFMGCVDQLRVNESSGASDLFMRYNDIYIKREKLIDFIFKSKDEGVMLMTLPVVSGTRKRIQDLFVEQDIILQQLETTGDFATGPINIAISTFAKNVNDMCANEGMFTDPELYDLFSKMKGKMREVSRRMTDEEQKKRFLDRIVI